jgi:hypothetical protein
MPKTKRISATPRPTPTPIPAFAPVDRPLLPPELLLVLLLPPVIAEVEEWVPGDEDVLLELFEAPEVAEMVLVGVYVPSRLVSTVRSVGCGDVHLSLLSGTLQPTRGLVPVRL